MNKSNIIQQLEELIPEIDGNKTRGWRVQVNDELGLVRCENGTNDYIVPNEYKKVSGDGFSLSNMSCIEFDDRNSLWYWDIEMH